MRGFIACEDSREMQKEKATMPIQDRTLTELREKTASVLRAAQRAEIIRLTSSPSSSLAVCVTSTISPTQTT